MNDNPYQSPTTEADPAAHGMSIAYRIFEGKWITFSARGDRDRVRELAQVGIADEIGAENVVSVLEHEGPPFSVVVWYRVRDRSATT